MWLVTDVADAMANVDALMAVRNEAYGGAPARVSQTLVQGAGLVLPELLIEIKVIARV